MNEFQGTAVVVALFALRCVLPLALLFAIGYTTVSYTHLDVYKRQPLHSSQYSYHSTSCKPHPHLHVPSMRKI